MESEPGLALLLPKKTSPGRSAKPVQASNREVFRRSPVEGLDVIVLAKQNKKKLQSSVLAKELNDLFFRLEGEQRP